MSRLTVIDEAVAAVDIATSVASTPPEKLLSRSKRPPEFTTNASARVEGWHVISINKVNVMTVLEMGDRSNVYGRKGTL